MVSSEHTHTHTPSLLLLLSLQCPVTNRGYAEVSQGLSMGSRFLSSLCGHWSPRPAPRRLAPKPAFWSRAPFLIPAFLTDLFSRPVHSPLLLSVHFQFLKHATFGLPFGLGAYSVSPLLGLPQLSLPAMALPPRLASTSMIRGLPHAPCSLPRPPHACA